MEGGEEGGFAPGDGVDGGFGSASEAGGGGEDDVDVVPDAGRADAPEGSENEGEEESVAGGGAGGVFGCFFVGARGDDGVGVVGSGEVGREEGA